jgi:hypothetical protein
MVGDAEDSGRHVTSRTLTQQIATLDGSNIDQIGDAQASRYRYLRSTPVGQSPKRFAGTSPCPGGHRQTGVQRHAVVLL